ncbi:MAG TPA: hypothetical protein PLA68_03585 [Panacibacter sp.]|nr:hypothetical protein [Panacibacter sp.]
MLKTVKHHKSAKNKKSKALKRDIAIHPFTIVTVIAAVAVVIWVIMFNWFRIVQ